MLEIRLRYLDGGRVLLRTNEAVNGKRQSLELDNEGDAMRLAYFWNRLYIHDKLKAWLNQRIYALKYSNDKIRIAQAAELIYMLECYRSASLNTICTLIYDQRDRFAFVAPGEKSSHYKIYKNIVVSIISFCGEIKENSIKK